MAQVFLVGMAVVDFVFSVAEFPKTAEKSVADDAGVVGGGCAANAAVAVARLGGEAILAARLGNDSLADLILSELAAEGVQTGFVDRAPHGRSSFSSIYVDDAGERQIVNFRGRGLSESTDWLTQAPPVQAILVDTRWTAGALAALDLAKSRGIPGVVDAEAPIDPEILKRASHVAFSRQGLASLTPETDTARALQEVAAGIPGWACVTDGVDGVYFTAGDQIEHVAAFKVPVRDTLAAGDIWHGAFTLRLAEGADEVAAIDFANAAAALKCMVPGGRSGCPDRTKTDEFLKERRICS